MPVAAVRVASHVVAAAKEPTASLVTSTEVLKNGALTCAVLNVEASYRSRDVEALPARPRDTRTSFTFGKPP